MDLTKISNFSIDHILGSEVGPSYPLVSESMQHSGHFQGVLLPEPSYEHKATGIYYMHRPLITTHVVQVPTMPHTFDYTGSYQRYGSFNCHNADLYFSASKNIIPNDERGSYPLCTNLDQLGGHQINRGRIRTVFTDTQAKGLEQLFDVTDYPCVDARAELARKVGLTEEIVRVWFKNRRARRKKKNSTKNNSPDIATSNPDWTAVYNNTIQENILTGFL